MLMSGSIFDFRRPFGHIPSADRPPSVHLLGCACSVCWAHNYCDALKLFPLTDAELSQPFINYYRYFDYTAQFRREQRTSAPVERASS